MELNIVEHGKNRLVFELKGEGNTFCNALRKELWTDESINIADYNVPHSLVSNPYFVVEVSKGDPKRVILSAIERLRKKNKELKDKFKGL